MHHGTIVFIEIPVRDLKRAADFYSGLFSWQFAEDPANPRRWVFTPYGMGAMGAVTTERPAGQGGAKLAVAVDDLKLTVERAIALGGGPGAIVTTPAGSKLELIDPDGNHLWAHQSTLTRNVRPGQPGRTEQGRTEPGRTEPGEATTS